MGAGAASALLTIESHWSSSPAPDAVPVVDFTFSPPNPILSEVIAFQGTATGTGQPFTWRWIFGDGSPDGTTQNVNHAYTSPGTRNVELRVTNSTGGFGTRTRSVTVNPALTASFAFAPAQPAVGESVSFTPTVSGGWTPYTYSWTWGDGTSGSTAQSPSHTFGAAGTFTVALTVTDNAAPAHTATTSRSVTVTAALAADFTFTPTKPQVGESIAFTATATGGTSPYTYSWSWGDGTPAGSGPTPPR